MKRLTKAALLVSALIFVFLFSSCDMYSYVTPSSEVTYENPEWAPPYSSGIRYYYLPDIETYYDLSNQEFVYLYDGQWSYSRSLPPQYTEYDLSNGFVVALDYNTYQPWMHYHYYVSHYPRYYYRDYYDHSNIPYVRGFNENNKSAIYWSENERRRARNWDNENQRTNHQFMYSRPDREQQNSTNYNNGATRSPNLNTESRQQQNNGYNNREQPNRSDNNATRSTNSGTDHTFRQPDNSRNSTVTPPRTSGIEPGSRQQNGVTPARTPQNTNYYGRTIGQPVRVEKQMRERTPTNAPANAGSRNGRDSRNQNDNSRK